jgi:protein-tyrosine-phosphatase
MAEGLAMAQLTAAGQPDWAVSSAGVWARDGIAADPITLLLLAERGISLSDHRSRALTNEILAEVDLVLVMTRAHKKAVQFKFPEHADKVYLLSELVGPPYDISDPVGGPIESYRYIFNEVDDYLKRSLPHVIEAQRLMGLSKRLAAKRRVDSREEQANTLNSIGFTYEQRRDLRQAFNFYKRSLNLLEALGSPRADVVRENVKRVRAQLEDT